MTSPRAACTPALRAPARPRCWSLVITSTAEVNSRRARASRPLLWSTTRTTWSGGVSCAKSEATARTRSAQRASVYVHTTALARKQRAVWVPGAFAPGSPLLSSACGRGGTGGAGGTMTRSEADVHGQPTTARDTTIFTSLFPVLDAAGTANVCGAVVGFRGCDNSTPEGPVTTQARSRCRRGQLRGGCGPVRSGGHGELVGRVERPACAHDGHGDGGAEQHSTHEHTESGAGPGHYPASIVSGHGHAGAILLLAEERVGRFAPRQDERAHGDDGQAGEAYDARRGVDGNAHGAEGDPRHHGADQPSHDGAIRRHQTATAADADENEHADGERGEQDDHIGARGHAVRLRGCGRRCPEDARQVVDLDGTVVVHPSHTLVAGELVELGHGQLRAGLAGLYIGPVERQA